MTAYLSAKRADPVVTYAAMIVHKTESGKRKYLALRGTTQFGLPADQMVLPECELGGLAGYAPMIMHHKDGAGSLVVEALRKRIFSAHGLVLGPVTPLGTFHYTPITQERRVVMGMMFAAPVERTVIDAGECRWLSMDQIDSADFLHGVICDVREFDRKFR